MKIFFIAVSSILFLTSCAAVSILILTSRINSDVKKTEYHTLESCLNWGSSNSDEDMDYTITQCHKAADAGDIDAMLTLGKIYWFKSSKDDSYYKQALEAYSKAGRAGSIDGAERAYIACIVINAGEEHICGEYKNSVQLMVEDLRKPEKEYYTDVKNRALSGNTDAATELCRMYFSSSEKYAEYFNLAQHWCGFAAENGSIEAIYLIAKNTCGEDDYEKIIELLEVDELSNYPPALSLLGDVYWILAHYENPLQNSRKALELLTRSAGQGYAPAQSLLGRIYYYAAADEPLNSGIYDELFSREKAIFWLEKAAMQKDSAALTILVGECSRAASETSFELTEEKCLLYDSLLTEYLNDFYNSQERDLYGLPDRKLRDYENFRPFWHWDY